MGSETYIPALDYFTAHRPSPSTGSGHFERQWLFYKLWGRLLYDPKTPDARVPGRVHAPLRQARRAICCRPISLASNTQMRLASLYDSRWDFTLYGEGMLALQGEHTNYIGVDALINQPTLDPAYVSVADYVQDHAAPAAPSARIASRRCSSPTCSNATVARQLRLVSRIDTRGQRLAAVRSGRCEDLGLPRRFISRKNSAARSRSATYRIAGDEEHQAAGDRPPATGARVLGRSSSASRGLSTAT